MSRVLTFERIIIIVLLLCLVFTEYRTSHGNMESTDSTTNVCVYNDIIKTVSHINLEEDNNLELIYKDTDNDIAYYRFRGERDLVNIGDVLTTCYGDKVTITYCDVYGFRVNNSKYFSPGMSGTGLLNSKGQIVGYVSEMLKNDEVYCIWN